MLAKCTRRSVVLVLMVGILAFLPSTALARIETGTDFFDVTDSFDDCGFTINFHDVGHATFRDRFDSHDVFQSSRATVEGLTTYTNPENGLTATNEYRQSIKTTVAHGDGTISFFTTYRGLHERLIGPDGKVLTQDRGSITFRNTYTTDDNGDPAEFISSEILRVHGPHPEADSDFELFCEVLTDAIGSSI